MALVGGSFKAASWVCTSYDGVLHLVLLGDFFELAMINWAADGKNHEDEEAPFIYSSLHLRAADDTFTLSTLPLSCEAPTALKQK